MGYTRMHDTRKVQIKNSNSEWIDINFMDLKDGDIFRMFESTGEEVVGLYDKTEWTVSGDVYETEHGSYAVRIRD